ncbi:hypothetical protein [Paenibacillus pini]|uniref:hypothetical protein n=1 Tax=Paenibacillus pini TaxID=669461 RepID=UPI000B181A97|nr:hypothetical protein [Paenibacillus pini]
MILPFYQRAISFCVFREDSDTFLLKTAESTERLWKSGSGRLGLQIFTAKGNDKNLESTAIGTTVRSRSVLASATVYPTFQKHFLAYGTAFLDIRARYTLP